MKICPYCAEDIQTEAIKCRYCNEFLDGVVRKPAEEQALPFYLKTPFIVCMFLTVPPFALPSVWLHPKLHLIWKLVITAAILALCWLSYVSIVAFIHQFDEATKMFEQMKL